MKYRRSAAPWPALSFWGMYDVNACLLEPLTQSVSFAGLQPVFRRKSVLGHRGAVQGLLRAGWPGILMYPLWCWSIEKLLPTEQCIQFGVVL
jgi:hypothetical protein